MVGNGFGLWDGTSVDSRVDGTSKPLQGMMGSGRVCVCVCVWCVCVFESMSVGGRVRMSVLCFCLPCIETHKEKKSVHFFS